MNKTDLIAIISEKTELTKKDVEKVISAELETIKETLGKNEKITLLDFGTFSVRYRKATKGRNPQTGEAINIPASKTVGFKPGKDLRERVN